MINESIILRSLWLKYGQGQLACNNILILRESGTVIEYEVKLSVSDYKAGQRKRQIINPMDKRRRMNPQYTTQKRMSRYDYLLKGYGANMFYYVAPKQVLEAVDIPDWAGVIEASDIGAQNRIGIEIKKRASYLHRDRPGDELKEKIQTSIYYKYWRHFTVRDKT